MDNHIYVTDGCYWDGSHHVPTEILDPSTESWQEVGNFAVRIHDPAAVAIPSSIIESECFEIISKKLWYFYISAISNQN